MSTCYPVRLRWSQNPNDRWAVCDGVMMQLRVPPPIPGLEGLTELDFVPNIVAQVRIGCDAIRDLSAEEWRRAMVLLQTFAAGARDAYDGGLTLAVVLDSRSSRDP